MNYVFLDEPHDKDIHEQSKENGNTLNLNINISKIFPTPSCGAYLNVSRGNRTPV